MNKRILEKFASEIVLLGKHINVIFNASSYEEAKQHKALFGDDEMFGRCIEIYQLLSK